MKFFLVASILLLLVLLFAYICYRITFHSPHKHQNDIYNIPPAEQYQAQKEMTMEMIRSFDALPFERVFITSRDGLKLSGRYYHRRDGAPLGIGFHGYRGTAIRDFCGGGTISLDAGHNLLLIDQRSQNLSEGHTITFGVKERFDCLDWVQYAVDRFGPDVQILLYGISMGASTVLMVSECPRHRCGFPLYHPCRDHQKGLP